MTYEEALTICRLAKKAIAIKHDPNNDANDVESMMMKMQDQIAESADLDFMTAAIEKQIPKKITILNGVDFCPVCGFNYGLDSTRRVLGSWKMPYCALCGQRLDWKDEQRPVKIVKMNVVAKK